MRLASAPVVLPTAAALTAPALWAAFVTDQLETETALLRFAVVAALTWVAFAAVAAMVGRPPQPESTGPGETSGAPGAAGPAETFGAAAAPDPFAVPGGAGDPFGAPFGDPFGDPVAPTAMLPTVDDAAPA